MSKEFYEKMFTESVQAAQEHYGTRKNYERIEAGAKYGSFEGLETSKGFHTGPRRVYIAMNEDDGRISSFAEDHGISESVNDKTLGYADFKGNCNTSAWGIWQPTTRPRYS
jgi:hypothetical protein